MSGRRRTLVWILLGSIGGCAPGPQRDAAGAHATRAPAPAAAPEEPAPQAEPAPAPPEGEPSSAALLPPPEAVELVADDLDAVEDVLVLADATVWITAGRVLHRADGAPAPTVLGSGADLHGLAGPDARGAIYWLQLGGAGGFAPGGEPIFFPRIWPSSDSMVVDERLVFVLVGPARGPYLFRYELDTTRAQPIRLGEAAPDYVRQLRGGRKALFFLRSCRGLPRLTEGPDGCIVRISPPRSGSSTDVVARVQTRFRAPELPGFAEPWDLHAQSAQLVMASHASKRIFAVPVSGGGAPRDLSTHAAARELVSCGDAVCYLDGADVRMLPVPARGGAAIDPCTVARGQGGARTLRYGFGRLSWVLPASADGERLRIVRAARRCSQ